MANNIIQEINSFKTFRFDEEHNKIINLKNGECTNIDEFLEIQYILDKNRVVHSFESNFEIQIIK